MLKRMVFTLKKALFQSGGSMKIFTGTHADFREIETG